MKKFLKIVDKKIIIMFLVILITIGLGFLVKYFFSFSSGSTESNVNFNLKSITADSVSRIEITNSDNAFVFEKKDEKWKSGDVALDGSKVNNLISLLHDAEIGDLVSSNPSNFGVLGINDENGTLMKFYSGDNLVSQFVIGNYATGAKVYIRQIDGKKVYTLDANIFSLIHSGIDDWKVVEEKK